MRFTYPAFSPPHTPVINRLLASGFQGMDTSMDHSSPELSAVDLKLSTLESSPSFSSLYSAGCSTSSGLVCPSLDSSTTLSSDGFAELETDLDSGDISPIGEPFVGGTAYDSIIGSAGDLEIGDDAAPLDLATPRPLRMERRSYFRQLGRGGDDKYGHGEGVKVIPDGQWPEKGILGLGGDSKVDKADTDTFGRSARLGNARDKSVSRYLAGRTTHDGRETLQNQNQKGEPTPGDACILEGESDTTDFIETRALPPTKAKRRYADLGLGLPSAWHGEPTPKADAMSTSTSFSLTLGPLNTITDKMQDDPSRSCKKITLTPIDAVLAFVQTPSPIEPLPSSILFADKSMPMPVPMDAHELDIRSLPGYRNGLNILAASASVGLGIRIAEDQDQQV